MKKVYDPQPMPWYLNGVRNSLKSIVPRSWHPLLRGLRKQLKYLRKSGIAEPYRTILPYTMVPLGGLKKIMELMRELNAEGIAGSIVEAGVCDGGSAGLLACAIREGGVDRDLWLFDSFEGLPEPSEMDGIEARGWQGEAQGSLRRLHRLFSKLQVDMSTVRIVPGWFHETFPTVAVDKVALIHIDADWYESVKLCLEFWYPKVVPGGYVVLDDYDSWPGCHRATDEFTEQLSHRVEIIRTGVGGAFFRKP